MATNDPFAPGGPVQPYAVCKSFFEQHNAKVGSRFACTSIVPGTISIFKRSDFHTKNEHLKCTITTTDKNGVQQEKDVSFIKQWMKDPAMRNYNRFEMWPGATAALCPTDVYNTWTPFAVESITLDMFPTHADLQRRGRKLGKVLAYLGSLCDDERKVYNFVLDWHAQLLQYPENQSIMIIFVSEQGTGKSMWIDEFLVALLGDSKCIGTAKPELQVWGRFNSLMATAFLVHVQEINQNNFVGHEGEVKKLITDGKSLTIEQKGKDAFKMKWPGRVIASTNTKDNPVPPHMLTNDQRRFCIIPCSEKHMGDDDYFHEFKDLIKDPEALRLFYNYMMARTVKRQLTKTDIPETAYHKLELDAIQRFVKARTANEAQAELVFTPDELYAAFGAWCQAEGVTPKADTKDKFLQQLGTKKIDGVRGGKKDQQHAQIAGKRTRVWKLEVAKVKAKYADQGGGDAKYTAYMLDAFRFVGANPAELYSDDSDDSDYTPSEDDEADDGNDDDDDGNDDDDDGNGGGATEDAHAAEDTHAAEDADEDAHAAEDADDDHGADGGDDSDDDDDDADDDDEDDADDDDDDDDDNDDGEEEDDEEEDSEEEEDGEEGDSQEDVGDGSDNHVSKSPRLDPPSA